MGVVLAVGVVWMLWASRAGRVDSVVPGPDLQPLVSAGYATEGEDGSYAFDRRRIDHEIGLLPASDDTVLFAYDRDRFGQRWADVDRNGCDTRNDMLRVWLTDVTFKPRTRDCVVLSGTLVDPFGGETIAFVRGEGTSEAVQIDHLWPLSAAWRRGADSWTEEKRLRFANDPLNLTPVDGRLNSSKGDSGPEWMPPNAAYRCTYAARLALVATDYQLELTLADRGALSDALRRCG